MTFHRCLHLVSRLATLVNSSATSLMFPRHGVNQFLASGNIDSTFKLLAIDLLTERKLWRQAAEAILALDAVHPRAQELFVEVWRFLDWARKEFGGDDDPYFALLRKVLPHYDGPDQVRDKGRKRHHATVQQRERPLAGGGGQKIEPVVLECIMNDVLQRLVILDDKDGRHFRHGGPVFARERRCSDPALTRRPRETFKSALKRRFGSPMNRLSSKWLTPRAIHAPGGPAWLRPWVDAGVGRASERAGLVPIAPAHSTLN